MAGFLDLKVNLIKGGIEKYGQKNPMYAPGNFTPVYTDYLMF